MTKKKREREWVRRDLHIQGKGVLPDVEVPAHWDLHNAAIVADKYLHKQDNNSLHNMMERVVDAIAIAGHNLGYFESFDKAEVFAEDLMDLVYWNHMSWNSPVWFNVGLSKTPQCWACLIVEVEDTMHSEECPRSKDPNAAHNADLCRGIVGWIDTEADCFGQGSGSGANVSKIRADGEPLSGRGTASGPLGFMRWADAGAGTIKSGGRTRRAAKMVVMDVDHPDIQEFIWCKAHAEKMARTLKENGFDLGINGMDSSAIPYQNANNSVRVTDEFMDAVLNGETWNLRKRLDPQDTFPIPARVIWQSIVQAAWECADPGLQFHDTINRWHTVPKEGPITASNPCLVGSTLVDTLDGRIPIKKLARMQPEELPMVWAFDLKTRMPVLRKIKRAWRTKKTKRLVRVTTDKGLRFLVTPDHKFLVGGGKGSAHTPDIYVQAKDLVPGQSLRKIARGINVNRSNRRYIDTREGTKIQARYIWEEVNGPIPEGYEIDHKDGDPTNDSLSNLQIIDAHEHDIKDSSGERNGRYIQAVESILVGAWSDIEENQGDVTVHHWNRYIRENNLLGVIPLARGDGRIRGKSWEEFSEEVLDLRNDKVAKIEFVEKAKPVSVYDLEVEGTHNFAITTGSEEDNPHSVVVHNCSEYMSIGDTVCNLASENFESFWNWETGEFLHKDFTEAVRKTIRSMDILVDMSSYPRQSVRRNTLKLRNLGIGFAGLGSTLMSHALPYDSDEGRNLAAGLAYYLQAVATYESTVLAEHLGPYPAWKKNKKHHLEVLEMHRREALKPRIKGQFDDIWESASNWWGQALGRARQFGMRNSQISVIAPTGTIQFVMGCETSGIEPALAIKAEKTLVGGGMYELGVQRCMARAITKLRNEYFSMGSKIEPEMISDENIIAKFPKVFQTALGDDKEGTNALSPLAHIRMMEVVQPSVSGAISKTVNMPRNTTVEEVGEIYAEAHKRGLKAIAIYRDGCKSYQPVNMTETEVTSVEDSGPGTLREAVAQTSEKALIERAMKEAALPELNGEIGTTRVRMPGTRRSVTHKFQLGDIDFYLTMGFYDDGRLGEIFVKASQEGSFVAGTLDAFATAISLGLQYGVPLEVFADKFIRRRFEPAGFVKSDSTHEDLKTCTSCIDYIFKYLTINEYTGERVPITWDALWSRNGNSNGHYSTVEQGPNKVWVDGEYLGDYGEVKYQVPSVWVPNPAFVNQPNPMEGPHEHNQAEGVTTPLATASGDICSECGMATLVWTGSCQTCQTCGFNSGCG